jgi:hypothetical protein
MRARLMVRRPIAIRPIATAPMAIAPAAAAPTASAKRLGAGGGLRCRVSPRAIGDLVPSNKLQAFQARMAFLANDKMIVHRDAQRRGDDDDLLCHLDVGA